MWVAATLVSLALLIILTLCIPLDVTLHIDVNGRPTVRAKLVWLFGLISKEIRKGKKKPREKGRVVEGKRKPGERWGSAKAIFQILRTKGLLTRFKRLLKDILTSLKVRDLRTNFRIGLGNPADTGIFFAIIEPATFFLKSPFPHQIKVQPAFGEAVFEGDLYGVVRLQPIQLVTSLLRFALSLSTMRVLKILVLTKWKRKK